MTPLARFLKKARRASGMSLRQLADAADTCYVNIHDIESGKNANPTVKMIKAISHGLDINPVDMFKAAL